MEQQDTETEMWPDISQSELCQHTILFYSQGPLSGHLTGERARDVFLHSRLPLTVLSKIWNLADASNDNLLNVSEFIVALHLINGVLGGKQVPKVLPENLEVPSQEQVSIEVPSVSEREAYNRVFQKCDQYGKGLINGEDAVEIFKASKLESEKLASVWDWSDFNRDGCLSREEWVVACHLLRHLKNGKSLDGIVNPFDIVPDKVSPSSLLARKTKIEDYEKHKQRLMQLKEKRKVQIERESRRLELLKEKKELQEQLIAYLKNNNNGLLSEEEINQITQSDKENLEKLEEIVARLKKEHELVRQETVQVILGEQKLQLEHRLLKNELDELTKRLGTQHTKATKDPDPFHQLYEQRKEERKKSNLSEGEEPEVHLPFNPFDTESLHHSSVSGSHLFLSPNSLNNNNTKHPPETQAFLESLKEFGEDFLGVWSNDPTPMAATEDEDPVFKTVEVSPSQDPWVGLNWGQDMLTSLNDLKLQDLHRKLVDLRSEFRKLNQHSGGQLIFRNPSDYLARKKEKEEEEQKEKYKFPRRSKSSADKEYTAKRRSYAFDSRKNDDIEAAREKRLNRRSLNLDNRTTEKARAPEIPPSSPNRKDKPETLLPKSSTLPKSKTTTSPTHFASTKKTRAPPPPCTSAKDSKIPVPSGAGNLERPPRRQKSSSGEEPSSPEALEANGTKSPRSSFLYDQEKQETRPQTSAVNEVFVSVEASNDSSSAVVRSSDIIPEEPATTVPSQLDSEPVSKPSGNVIETEPVEEIITSDCQENQTDIIVNHSDVKRIEILPEVSEEEEKEKDTKVVTFVKGHIEIPNPDTVSLCSIDSIPPDLPISAPPPLLPKQPDTASIGEEAVVVAQEVQIAESAPSVVKEEIVHPVEELKQETAKQLEFSDNSFKDNSSDNSNPVKMSVEVNGKPEEITVSWKEEPEFEVESDADSDISDLLNQNGSYTPGDDKTDHVPLSVMDEDEDSGDIQLLSHSNTSVQSPTSQADSAFEDMVSSNQVSLSSTLEDVKDISDTLEQVKVTPAESQPQVESAAKEEEEGKKEEEEEFVKNNQKKVEFIPTQAPQSSVHSSYVTEVPLSDSKTFVRKAQQFSEIVNQPPKMTIRSTSKEMSDEHLQKVDVERKAVLSQSIVKRRGITEFSTVHTTEESKPADVKSSLSLDVNGEKDILSPVKSKGTPINFEEKPPKVDLYSHNVVQEDGNTDTVNRESIADLSSTRKQWETLLQSSGTSETTPSKVTPKKSNTPVKHWEVKLPYKPEPSPKTVPNPEIQDTQPKKSFKMEDDPYANESAIEREIRLANEREEMLRKEQEERMELAKRQNASKNQVNTKMFENENNNNNADFKAMYHEMTEADRGSELQKRESLIQQEIEEQKEREEALTTKNPPAVSAPQDGDNQESSRESLIAKEIRLQKEREEEIAKRHSLKKEPEIPQPEPAKAEPVSSEQEKMEAPITNKSEVTYEEAIQEPFHHDGESLIAKELREAKEREEEIRRMRERTTGGKSASPAPVATSQPSIKSQTPTRETVKKTWQPSPSVQTTKVSSHTPSRSVRVQPIPDSTDEDQIDSKPVEKKETPIEREIRIARERENELRSQKGLPLLSEPLKPAEDDSQSKSFGGEDSVSYSYRSKVNTAEGNKSMRNFASHRLQNEILKQKEREHKLRDEGKILSTSEEHIGTFKYTEVAGIPKSDGPVKRNFVTRKSTSSLPLPGDSPSSSNTPSENGDVEPPKMSPQISKEEPVKYKRPTVKTGGASFSYRESRNQAESKIEKELREMREREEELKKSRGGTLSPPTSPRDTNLSSRKAQFEQV